VTVTATGTVAGGTGELWRQAQGGAYARPDAGELEVAERLFRRTLAAEPAHALAPDWARLGFDLRAAEVGGRVCQALAERVDERRGRGFYLVCPDTPGAVVLQAPHALSDLGTGEIAMRLADEGTLAAVAWSTVPRGQAAADGGEGSDLAHQPESYLVAFSRAVAAASSARPVVQLHGFAAARRRSAEGADADLIVSSGSRTPSPRVVRLARCLGPSLGVRARVYPTEVAELGGTTNVVGQALRRLGHGGFVHLELGEALRDRLRSDAGARREVLRCLAALES
jgi:hypothetical protein